jgi:phenylacetate-CoA ligase
LLSHLNCFILYPVLEKLSKRQISSKLKILTQYENQHLKNKKNIQKENLKNLISYCHQNIPYYKELFSKTSFTADKVDKDLRYFFDLPILTKDLVRENTHLLKLPSAVHPRKTGGSTGESVFFYYDNPGLDWTSAIHLHSYSMAGLRRADKNLHICSELEITPPTKKAIYQDKIKQLALNRSTISIDSFTEEEFERVYIKLRKYKPQLVQCHPSTMYAISKYIRASKKIEKKLFEVFEPSGETVTQKIVNEITSVCGCTVANRYGNAEFGVMAHTIKNDPYTKLKVFDYAFLVEECNESNLIVTGLTNYGMPLLRYDTGDMGTVTNEDSGTFINNLSGRIHEIVKIQGKEYPSHYIMDFLDHKVKGVREFQIKLSTKEPNPCLNIVLEDPNDEQLVKELITHKWNDSIDVSFVNFEQLERKGWRQKFSHVVRI